MYMSRVDISYRIFTPRTHWVEQGGTAMDRADILNVGSKGDVEGLRPWKIIAKCMSSEGGHRRLIACH
jgi:hypothetical protein